MATKKTKAPKPGKTKEKISESTRRRNDFIAYFNQLRDVKENGIAKYAFQYCVAKAAYKFYYKHKTAELYVSAHAKKQ